MVFSVIHQFISSKNPFKIHLVLVDDYIEGRLPNNESYYNYYTSEEFKKFYNPDQIKITIVKNETHKYQGESREIGWNAGDYNYFILVDCDDMLAPNICDKYLYMINIEKEKEDSKPVACIHGLLYGFDTDGYEQKIVGHSIWVQSRCYNREFIKKYGIHCPTGLNSKQGEDYPFIKKLDYALSHTQDYSILKFPYENNEDCQCSAYWFPNENSLSRKLKHYSQH